MNNTLKVIGMLLGASLFFNVSMNYMGDNIAEFENRPLPAKKIKAKEKSHNPTLKVIATSRDNWVLVDFSTKETFHVEDLDNDKEKLDDQDWDLGFQRTKIITNSGVTHPKGGAGAVNLGKVDFEKITKLPTGPFIEDTRKWGNVKNEALADWYLYRTRTHNVESKKAVFVVRTADQGHMKMRILNYYCDRDEAECATGMCTREEAACLTLEYVYIPPGETTFPVFKKKSSPSSEVVSTVN